MDERERLVDAIEAPTLEQVSDLIGHENARRWKRLLNVIDTSYPGVFVGEWLYRRGGHGWSLRFKKSKSFCTMIPERDRVTVLIVFGHVEREKADSILPMLKSHARDDYVDATTYHDGKWVLLDLDGDDVLEDVIQLLAIKRRPSA